MLTAVKLVDQWSALERRLPADWETVALRLRTEQPDELSEAARVLGPMSVGRVGRRARRSRCSVRAAPAGPEAARRLFARLDEARVWCLLEQGDGRRRGSSPARGTDADARAVRSPRRGTRRSPSFPSDWSDLLCCARARLERPPAPRRAPLRARSTRRATATGSASRSAARSAAATASRRRWRAAASSASTPRASRRGVGAARALRHRPRRHPGRRLVRRRQGPVGAR